MEKEEQVGRQRQDNVAGSAFSMGKFLSIENGGREWEGAETTENKKLQSFEKRIEKKRVTRGDREREVFATTLWKRNKWAMAVVGE